MARQSLFYLAPNWEPPSNSTPNFPINIKFPFLILSLLIVVGRKSLFRESGAPLYTLVADIGFSGKELGVKRNGEKRMAFIVVCASRIVALKSVSVTISCGVSDLPPIWDNGYPIAVIECANALLIRPGHWQIAAAETATGPRLD